MNRMFQPTANAVLFRLSDAAEHHRGKGNFKVLYRRNEEKTFPTLVDAFLFYIALDEEADLMEAGQDEKLIERKVRLCLN